jgi:hypothetical protein
MGKYCFVLNPKNKYPKLLDFEPLHHVDDIEKMIKNKREMIKDQKKQFVIAKNRLGLDHEIFSIYYFTKKNTHTT